MNGVSCVDQSSSVKNVKKFPTVVPNLPVGARLHQFWKKWAALGISPRVLTVLGEDCTLPFQFRPDLLCKSPQEPLPVGGIASAVEQKCSRVGQKSRIPRFLQLAILGTKTQQLVETYTGPQQPKQIFTVWVSCESFKMETTDKIRTSLQAGEWVTSIDFKDAYLHISFHSQSRK